MAFAAIMLIIAACYTVGGLAAFGGNLLALPIFLTFDLLDLHQGRVLVLCCGSVLSVQLLICNWRDVDRKRLRQMILVMLVTVPLGLLGANLLPRVPLLIALGLVLLAAGINGCFAKLPELPRAVLLALLATGGLIHGAFGTGGATIAVFSRLTMPERDRFRATFAAFWCCVNPLTLTLTIMSGPPLPDGTWSLLGLAVVVVTITGAFAQRLAKRIPPEPFRRFVAVLLIVAGLITIGRLLPFGGDEPDERVAPASEVRYLDPSGQVPAPTANGE